KPRSGREPSPAPFAFEGRGRAERAIAPLLRGAAAVRPRDDLEVVAVRIVPVDASSAVVAVDLAGSLVHRICPVVEPVLAYPREDRVEVGFFDEKGVVLDRHGLVRILKVERDAVRERDRPERTEPLRRLEAENLAEEPGGRERVARGHYRVIQLDRHEASFR